MNARAFLKKGMPSVVALLGTEEVVLSGVKIQANPSEITHGDSLGIGTNNNYRSVTILFPSSAFPNKIKAGMIAETLGEKWQVSADDGAVRIDGASTLVTLIEPGRKRE